MAVIKITSILRISLYLGLAINLFVRHGTGSATAQNTLPRPPIPTRTNTGSTPTVSTIPPRNDANPESPNAPASSTPPGENSTPAESSGDSKPADGNSAPTNSTSTTSDDDSGSCRSGGLITSVSCFLRALIQDLINMFGFL